MSFLLCLLGRETQESDKRELWTTAFISTPLLRFRRVDATHLANSGFHCFAEKFPTLSQSAIVIIVHIGLTRT